MPYKMGFLFGLIYALIVILVINSRKNNNKVYDERQIFARGDAFKAGFITLIAYVAISELIVILTGKEWITAECNLTLSISLSMLVFAIVSIVKDAYAGFGQSFKANFFPTIIIALNNTIMGIMNIWDEDFKIIKDNKFDLDTNFTVGFMLLIVAIVYAVHTKISNKREEEYEES